MNEDHLPSLSESEKEEIQKEADERYDITSDDLDVPQYNAFIAGASLQLRKAKKREAEFVHWMIWNRWIDFKGDSEGNELYSRFMGVLPKDREWLTIEQLQERFKNRKP